MQLELYGDLRTSRSTDGTTRATMTDVTSSPGSNDESPERREEQAPAIRNATRRYTFHERSARSELWDDAGTTVATILTS